MQLHKKTIAAQWRIEQRTIVKLERNLYVYRIL